MTQARRSWDLLTDEERKQATDEIIIYFKEERGEEIGIIAAEELLDRFLQLAGITLYNKGVDDARKLLKDRIEGIEIDLGTLTKERR